MIMKWFYTIYYCKDLEFNILSHNVQNEEEVRGPNVQNEEENPKISSYGIFKVKPG